MSKAKEIAGLECGASAASGIRRVLGVRFKEMWSLRAEALDWSDIEGVHDMRVASRRLRSALRDFKPYLKQSKLRGVSDELKKIADALGTVRDEDVAIDTLEKLAAEAPTEFVAGVKQFAMARRMRREGERAALVKALEDVSLSGLQAKFDKKIEKALKVSRDGDKKDESNALETSFRQAGREIIRARVEELRSLSAGFYQPRKTKPLHRIRIASKRLRYAVELFAQCWNDSLAPFAKEVEEMQGSLGDLHDCDVWIEEFGKLLTDRSKGASRVAAAQAVEPERLAAVWLLRHYAKARTKHYRKSLASWQEWETSKFFARLNQQLETRPPIELSSVTLSAADAVAADLRAQHA
jgi:CHAD domain-containing protein